MSDNILICGVNWLGDAVMSMPAVQMLRQRRPRSKLTMLVKEKLVPLWKMQEAVDEIVSLPAGGVSTLSMGCRLRSWQFDCAYVFPNSFRSALVAFLGRIPRRVGVPGHYRAWMLTQVPEVEPVEGRYHQAWEYLDLVGVADDVSACPAPRLTLTESLVSETRARLGIDAAQPWVALIPGAARGPAKQWPASCFAEVGREAARRYGCRSVVLGTAAEKQLCSGVALAIGDGALNAAGQTTIPELSAALGACAVAVTNDSGGMHLAAAVGARVVAVFGITDPAKTGPLGDGHRVVTAEGIRRSRDLTPDSPVARKALRSVPVDSVVAAVEDVLAGGEA